MVQIVKTAFQAAAPRPIEVPRMRRARSYPRRGKLVLTSLLLILGHAGLALFLVGGIQLLRTDEAVYGIASVAGLGLFAVCRISVFAMSRSLTCPLCHGTVLHEKRCRKHADAFKLPLLSYRLSAVLSLLLTWGFRCMYCSTAFRLWK